MPNANAKTTIMVVKIWQFGGKMENLKRKIDAKRRGLEDLILQITISRKEMNDNAKLADAVHLGKALEFLAVANHNLWMSTIALGNTK